MTTLPFFEQRYTVLYDYYLQDLWDRLTPEQMRTLPHPKVNSICWILWHMARVEDAALNRFITDGEQVLDESWLQAIQMPLRHNGGGMTLDDVADFSRQIDLDGLHGYAQAVHHRTLALLPQLSEALLATPLDESRVRRVVVDEGLVYKEHELLITLYSRWTKGMTLFNHALTHPYQHLGEISIIATLLGVSFD